MASQVRALFGEVPDTLDDFVVCEPGVAGRGAEVLHRDASAAAKWRRTGIIWWNLLDGWPQFSDAVVDYYFAKKRAYEVVKRSQQQLSVVVCEPVDGSYEVVACNDARDDLDVQFKILDVESGATIAAGHAMAAADAVTPLATIATTPDQRCFVLEWTSPLGPGRNHYLAGDPPFSLSRYLAWMGRASL